MSNSFKILIAVGLVAMVGACAQPAQEEYVVVEPITVEPVSSGKYGGKY